MRRDPVTSEMRQLVLTRDIKEWQARQPLFQSRRGVTHSIIGCIAVAVSPSTSGPCSGKLTLDHIHGQNEMGVGKPRAKSDPQHLVSLCQGHTEAGMRAGFQWNTANRPILRWYLKTLYGPDN